MLTALAALLAVAGCGGPDDEGAGGTGDEGDRPTIVATTGVVADLAGRVAGPDAELIQLIPDAVNPHDFALSVRDRATLGEADLVVAAGGGLEAGIPLGQIDAQRWELLEHIDDPIEIGDDGHGHDEDDGHAHDDGHAREDDQEHGGGGDGDGHADDGGHDHGPIDPHAWLDPTRVAGALGSLADALADVNPEARAGYERQASEYATELEALDAEIEEVLSRVPDKARNLVTSHDALGYFADRYHLEVVATPFGAAGPDAQVSARRLQQVIDAVDEHGVRAVFAQQTDDPKLLERVGAATGAEVVTGLLVEAPGDAGSYVEMMRTNAHLIADALE